MHEINPAFGPVAEVNTLVHLLQQRARYQANETAYLFLNDGETEEVRLTYGQLDAKARAIAAQLQDFAVHGERVLLLYPASLEYISAFFGCLYAGAIAVPVYPPHPTKPERSLPRIQTIAENAQPQVALMPAAVQPAIAHMFGQVAGFPMLHCLASDTIDPRRADEWREPAVRGETLAFLQYTSGSTAAPRGVMVSHANLLYNHRMIQSALRHPPDAPYLSWLPLFHDMGLIGNALQAVYTGVPCVLMSPMAFLQRPLRWLEAISRYRAATSGGPNFAYELCVRQTTAEQRAALDLSGWRVAFNGAEPVRADTIDRFSEAFKPAGFRREAFFPCYGLAEATLLVAGVPEADRPGIASFQSAALDQNRVVPCGAGEPNSRRLVHCGRAWLDQTIAIVDPETGRRCAPDQVGEIWVSGQSVGHGYWNQPEKSRQTFQAYITDTAEGPFLRTGDLGFIWDGQVFVGGRLKDVIIIRGRNHYPQDIETTVERSHPAFRPLCGAACAVDVAGEERLVIIQEVERTAVRKLDVEAVVAAIRRAVSEEHELDVYAVLLLKTGSIPKTSSGKIQRHACRAGFLSGNLAIVGEWRQPTAIADGPGQPDSRALAPTEGIAADTVRNWLANVVAEQLHLAPEDIDIRQPLAAYGLHSADLVRLSGQLEEWLGRRFSPTLLYDYPTIEALAQYLAHVHVSAASLGDVGRPAEAEPIAVIGIGCRFPGAQSPEAFWELLRDGSDSTTEVPASRWDVDAFYDAMIRPGKMNTRWGAFLEDIDRFDPAFFGLSPREAEQMDPQQRLLLEVSWEALEHAGLAPDRLAGQPAGVFIGISNNDYARLQAGEVGGDSYAGTGNAFSIAANRLSYVLDLRGPALAVDTACSSSLVAVHLACESLRRGESSLALAGGVNLILAPDVSVTLSQAHMLSPDGRCKTFDAGANGYVRGEGCGVVILKRLSLALRDGDTILAQIKGSAVNQDGRSNGITAPNGPAQQVVIRAALDQAGVDPAQVSYVEAHGSGTELGDPIEVQALKAVLTQGRVADQRCWIGSVKSNIGHLEAAAGIAGLIKTILALQHEEIPTQIHLTELNPHLGIEGTPLAIPTGRHPWPRLARQRFAGVSSFGFGGTNAHVVLEEAPEQNPAAAADDRLLHLLTLSAKEQPTLRALAARYRDFLGMHPDIPAADLCFSAGVGRSHFSHRLAVIAESIEQVSTCLAAFAAGSGADDMLSALVGKKPPKVVFLFTGQGAQYAGMGRRLYETAPVFRQALDQCAQLLHPHLGLDLREVLYPNEEGTGDRGQGTTPLPPPAGGGGEGGVETGRQAGSVPNTQHPTPNTLDQTWLTQPALFALEYALARLWQSWGVEPSVVLGHSVGEYVAACIAGIFSLEDGLKLVAERARLMQLLPEGGQMIAVAAAEETVAAIIAPYEREVAIAAMNGPKHCVVSGGKHAIQEISAQLSAQGVQVTPLNVSHAFHSPLMDPMLDAFAQLAAAVRYTPPQIPIVSNVTGALLTEEIATPAYWVEHVRRPVRFAGGMRTLQEQGYDVFVEIGPHPVLIGMGRQCREVDSGLWLPSLRKNHDELRQMLHSLGILYTQGIDIRWLDFDRPHARRRLPLPTYPWQRQRYWREIAPDTAPLNGKLTRRPANGVTEHAGHPLLGRRLQPVAHYPDSHTWEIELDIQRFAYFDDHRIGGTAVVPVSAYVEMALGAAAEIFSHRPCRVRDLALHQPLVLSKERPRTLQLTLAPGEGGRMLFRVYALPSGDVARSQWILHASAMIHPDTDRSPVYPSRSTYDGA